MNRLARRNRCTYTRYADDLTFSTNRKNFSNEIAVPVNSTIGDWVAGDELRYRILRSGFSLNPSKTRMQFYWSRQDTTGLIVNKKVNVPREYVKDVRTKCDYYFGGNIPFKKGSRDGKTPDTPISATQLQGMLAHIFQIKGGEFEFKRPKDWKRAPSYIITHQKFLDFSNFVKQSNPTILCEGETDNIYIRSSLRAFDKDYPAMIADDGSKTLKVKLYRYSRTTSMTQGLNGGTGDLIIYSYSGRVERFSVGKPAQPTILVVDNDQGSKGKAGVFSAVKNVSNGPVVDGTKQFYHITKNLYLVPTPRLPNAKDSMIEDFLEPSVRKTKLNGKTLNLNEKAFDKTKHYGKALFAKHVVRRRADKIDFSGYRPLLDAINAAIVDYAKRVSL